MEIPENYKNIEINGREFRLNKIDARTGSYMLFKIIKILAPVFKDLDLSKTDDFSLEEINLTDALAGVLDLPEKEFRYIQDNCLKTVQEMLPMGPTSIIDKDGNYGVEGIEFDVALLMNLTIQSLVFIVSGFFGENPLGSILEGLNLSQQSSAT